MSSNRHRHIISVVVAIGLAFAAGAWWNAPSADQGGDRAARLACQDFRSVDTVAGSGMSFGQLQERAQGIRDAAATSDTPGIADSSRELLTASQTLDVEAAKEAIARMAAACAEVGPV
jgi:hypothetical protein